MKKNYPAVMLGIGFMGFLVGAGCQESQARPDDVPTVVEVQPAIKKEKADEAKPAEASPAKPAENPSPTGPGSGASPASAASATGATNDTAVTPETLQPSPALAEVIRLLQGGVSEEVVLAYITNSAEPFNIGAEEILFLHDLGAPPQLITTLIQKDASPQMMALKQSAKAVQPLPPGVALTTPATNIFATSAPSNGSPQPVAVNPPVAAQPAATVAYTPPVVIEEPSYFYDELAPYGTWVEVSGYGRCWRPTVAVWNSSWRPYCDGGRWLWSDCGWYWYSDYSWGWAPFHYGRWACPSGLGWLWVPDTSWGPAWVSWRYSSAYCGWAPLPPSAHFVLGHGFYHNSLAVGFGFEFGLHASDYVFVSAGGLCDRRPRYLSSTHAATIYKDTTIVNNYTTVNNTTVVNHGVGFDRIQRATRGNIRQVALKGTTDVRVTNTRREVLDTDGKTLTVTQPPKVAPATRPTSPNSSGAASGFRPRTERRVATAPNPKEVSTGSTSSDADNSPRRSGFTGSGGSVPRTGFVTRSPGTQAKAPVTTSGDVGAAKADAPKSAPASPAAREPKNPFAPVTVRGVTPRPSRNEQPMVSDNPASRSEPTRRFTQPEPVRPPVANAPAPFRAQPQPRANVPSAPSPSPSVPAPSRNFTPPSRAAVPFPSSPRVETYRAPAAPPVTHSAPPAQPSAPAPAPRSEPSRGSSGGGGGESRSRGSDDGGGRRGR